MEFKKRFSHNLSRILKPPLTPGPWICGLSGGADSVALCLLLKSHQEIHLAHVNHHLREESDQDQAFCERLAQDLDLPLECVHLTPRESMGSLETWARNARFQAFEKIASELKAGAVFLGHHKDDQMETMVQRLGRGAGPAGLCGIPERRPLFKGSRTEVIRPLLGFCKQEILDWLKTQGRVFVLDKSNLNPNVQRNRIRLRLLPLLDQNTREELLLLMQEARALKGLCQKACQWILRKHQLPNPYFAPFITQDPEEIHLSRKPLEALHPELLYFLLNHLKGGDPLSKKAFEAVRRFIPGDVIELGELRVLRINSRALRMGSLMDKETFPSFTLKAPGAIELPDGSRIRAKIVSDKQQAQGVMENRNPLVQAFDFEAVGSELILRQRHSGDRFSPLGTPSNKKLKQALINAKVPNEIKDRLALVCKEERILWIPSVGLAHWPRVTESTSSFLILEAQPPQK